LMATVQRQAAQPHNGKRVRPMASQGTRHLCRCSGGLVGPTAATLRCRELSRLPGARPVDSQCDAQSRTLQGQNHESNR
jgi:hypothetical protein